MSDQTPPPIPPALMEKLSELSSATSLDLQELKGLSLEKILKFIFEKVMALKGQIFLKAALFLLTHLWQYLPPAMATALNDKVVAVLRAMMPNPPTDLTGHQPSPEEIGRANMPYARSVPVTSELAPDLPDSGAVFDKLLKRSATEDPDTLSKFSGGLSSLTFAFGTLVIHSVFFSDRSPPFINNKTSSYFDLAPLYGDTPSQNGEVRDKGQGRGLLHPDCFADSRMLFLPPGAAVILVLFNRNHNHIAQQLLARNEKGTWSDPPPTDPVARAKQDDEIHDIARLINGRHFVNVVITDYVGGIMGMVRRGGGWPGNAEALHEIYIDEQNAPRGDGNLVSIEFNLLYRWHATLSALDIKWIEDALEEAIGSRDWDHLGPADYERGARNARPLTAIKDRVFAGLTRLPTGYFADNDLSNLLYAATEDPAGFFRAHGTPAVMRCVELLGIEQARQWNTCTLNEFRTWLGLPPFKSFEDWNAAPEIAQAARDLYGDINRLELYAGLHAEGHTGDSFEMKYPPTRVDTMRNGLLLDAIALIRGDPRLTTEFTVENATEWGYNDVARDHQSRAFGGHIHTILQRTLPKNFPDNSIYTWFPMSTPKAMEANERLPNDPNNPWEFNRPITID